MCFFLVLFELYYIILYHVYRVDLKKEKTESLNVLIFQDISPFLMSFQINKFHI